MAAPDMDVIKEIPGYKVILKAVLKSQIQQLVEQLASHTDEESVILTASVSDGTLSHLGSDSGKFFLQDHEDIKSQFLGFCLKRHHRKKQEKDREEELQRLQFSPRHMAAQPSRYPPTRQGVHPVSLARASPGSHVRSPGARHEPYSVPRPRRSLNQNLSNQSPADSQKTMTLPTNNQVIKIEPQDEGSNQSAGDINNQRQSEKSSSPPSSPLHGQGSIVKTDNADESSTSVTANEASELPFSETQPAEGLGLDSDLSNLISGEQSVKTPSTSSGQTSEIDPDVNVKLESISESDMELEITGVEPGPGSVSSQDTSWAQNTSMGYDSSGATGNQADLQGQEGFNSNDTSYYVEDFDPKSTEDVQHISLPMKGHWNSFYSPGAEYSKMFTADEMLAKKVLRGAPTGAQSYFTGLIRDAAESVGIWKDPPPALNCMTEKQKSRFFDLVLYSAPQLKSRSREVWARFRQALQNRRKYVLDKRLGKRTSKGSKTIDA